MDIEDDAETAVASSCKEQSSSTLIVDKTSS